MEHALTASKPKPRYLVGRDAQISAVIGKVVPDLVRDGLVQRQVKPGKS